MEWNTVLIPASEQYKNSKMVAANLAEIGNVVLVLSGKGGVGKSSVSVQLASALALSGKKVGILDIDVCGPSVPQMLGLDAEVYQSEKGWIPVKVSENLKCMSIAFLLNSKSDAVIWRGPKKNSIIKQFVSSVDWGQLDYLIIDTPPGTSDEHISVMEALQDYENKSAILVTTPQLVSVGDVRREATFCEKTKVPVLGIVENMSGFICPNCKECSEVFSSGGGELLAAESGYKLIAKIPLDPALAQACEKGTDFLTAFQESAAAQSLQTVREFVESKLQQAS